MAIVKDRPGFISGKIVKDMNITKLKVITEANYVQRTDEKTGKTKENLQCTVEANGTQYAYTVNVTTEKFLSEKLGKDTKSWIGAVLDVRANPTPTGLGILVIDAHGAVLA